MRILLVKPNMGLVRGRPYYDRGRMEPLTLAVLATATPPGHTVHLCDDRCEPVPWSGGWDLVGINTEIYTARRAYEIADRFRRLGARVALGGVHASMVPDEAQAHADAVVVGDGERVWPQLVRDAAAGALQPRYVGGVADVRELCQVGCYDRRLFRGKRYLPLALTQLGRGCPHQCDYCATGALHRGSHAHRPISLVVEELARDGRRLVFFVDENIVADRDAALALFRALVPLRIRWIGQASLDFTSDPELFRALMQSGCAGLVVGFESRDPQNLGAMRKGVNQRHGTYDQVVERIRDHGLMLWAAFLLGYDHETVASIRETVDWAISKKFAFAAFNILMPYPTTPFYRRMQEEGRLLYDGRWWLHDDYRFGHAGFRPKLLTPEQLAEEGLAARLRHNRPRTILQRAWDPKTNAKDLRSLVTYLLYNPLFRDELLKKHGMLLGYRGIER